MTKTVAIAASLIAFVLSCCSSSKDAYHVGSERWVGDSIEVRLYKTSDPTAPTVSAPSTTILCRSCNFVDPPRELAFSDSGIAHVFMPETLYELDPRLHLKGSGIDTTIILHSRPPEQDARYYKLQQPLIGRVKLLESAPLYLTTDQDSVVTSARLGDEMNLFAEDAYFYAVHHPLFAKPLYLRKTNATRLY